MKAGLLLMFSIVAGAGALAPAAAQSAASPAVVEAAARLAELTIPAEAIQRDTKAAYLTNFRASFMRDPRAQAVGERSPAFLDSVMDAASAKLDEMLAALLQDIKADAAASYAQGLSPAELDAAVAFYSAPTGRKVVAAIPDLTKGVALERIFTPAETAELTAFAGSPAGRTLEALKLEQAAAVTRKMSEAFARHGPAIEQAAGVAGRAYLARNP